MRIVRMGPEVSTPWLQEATCKECQTVVELGESDIKRRWQQGDRPWESDGWLYTWVCPLCNEGNYIWGDEQQRMLKHLPRLKER